MIVGQPIAGPAVTYPAPLANTVFPGPAVFPSTYPSISVAAPMSAPVINSPPIGYAPTFTQTSYRTTSQRSSGGLAQRKAQRAANMRVRGHLGGSLGGARYEGVGWSTASPQQAIRHCCYWGQRQPMQIGVARGNDGWYACVLYR